MSNEDMSMSSWKYLTSASNRISSLKGYINNHRESGSGSGASSWRSSPGGHTPNDSIASIQEGPQQQENPRQSWRAWAGQKIRESAAKRRGAYANGTGNMELVNVFPGWAVRRYNSAVEDDVGSSSQVPRPFELEVFVSGYAISHRSPQNLSRAQRGFLRLAKGFASLPKIVDSPSEISPNSTSLTKLTPSTEALLSQVQLPPRPTEITDDYDVEALERQLRRAKEGAVADMRSREDGGRDEESSSSSASSSSSRSSTMDFKASGNGNTRTPSSTDPGKARTRQREEGFPPSEPHPHMPTTQEVIKQLHDNLEKRLQPFWSSVLPNRTIRLHLFVSPYQKGKPSSPSSAPGPEAVNPQNKDTEINITSLLSDAENNGGPIASQDILTAADGSFQVRFKVNWEELCHHPKALHIAFGEPEREEEHELLVVTQLLPAPSPPSSRLSLHSQPQDETQFTPAPLTSLTRIPITHSPIRVISDIDDTIKFSGILAGTRAVFHNVFVKDLRDNVIPGMGEWYTGMWTRGVRFHYVSNGPFELLPVINEFFELSQLPPGSIKLRSYAGRSLFNGLLSAPAARKKAGVVDILDSFPESKFFLIGDSGEQDMELYADIARERPHQILAIFVRDADAFTYGGPEPLEDPTGWKAVVSGAAGTRPNGRPLVHPNGNGSGNGSRTGTGTPERSDSTMTGMSASSDGSAWERYNYGAVGSRQNSDAPLAPPHPQFWSDGAGTGGVGGGRVDASWTLHDKGLAKARERQPNQTRDHPQNQAYFGVNRNGALSAEPEPLVDHDDDLGKTPTTPSSARLGPSPSVSFSSSSSTPGPQYQYHSSTPTPTHNSKLQYVTEPPLPTPPPSSSAPFPYSSKSQHHQMNSSTSSLSSSASTTNVNIYGYPSTSSSRNTNAPGKKGSTSSAGSGMTENEKKRHELQLRVWRARTQIPGNVLLRVFRDPGECVDEAGEILDREGT